MNYFRYLLLATTMFAFFASPAAAMEPAAPRASFFGRCYGYAAAWVSSSFLVTRDFVKREFSGLKTRLGVFNTDIHSAHDRVAGIERSLGSVRRDQTLYNFAFQSITKSQDVQLARHKQALENHKKEQEEYAAKLRAAREAAEKADHDIVAANLELEAAKQAIADEKTAIELHSDQVNKERQKHIETLKAHYETKNAELNQAMAALKANSNKMSQFSNALDLALADTRKRNEEQKKNSEQLAQLYKHAQEQERKVKALSAAFSGFRTSFYAAQLPRPSYAPRSFPGIKAESQSPLSSAASSASSSASLMEEID